MDRAGIDDALRAVPPGALVDVVGGRQRVGDDLLEALLARVAGEVQDGVAVAGDLERGGLVGEVADHDLLVRRRRAHVADVDEAQAVGQVREAVAQVAAEVAGGAGDQDAVIVRHQPCPCSAAARIALSVWRGVRLSVSTTSSINAPVALIVARSKAPGKSAVRANPLGVHPVGAADRDEVGVLDVGEADAAGIGPLLVHADRAVAAVVDEEHDRRRARLHRAAELLHRHLEVAVAGQADDAGLRPGELRGDRRRQAVAHRARLRPEQAHAAGERQVLVAPGREVAGAVGQDRSGRQHRRQVAHHRAHVELAGLRRRGEARLPGGVGGGEPGGPGRRRRRRDGRERRHQPVGMRLHRQVGGVHAVELVGRGVGVDQPRGHPRDAEERVAVAEDLAEDGADREDDVGLGQQRPDVPRLAEPAVAGIGRAGVVDQVLAAEVDDDRDRRRLGEGAQPGAAGLAPSAAAGDDQRPLGGRDEPDDRLDLGGGRRRLRHPDRRPGAAGGRAGQHVLGQRDDHRPLPAGHRRGEGAGDDLGDAVGVVDLGRPLGQRAEGGAVVDLLEGLAAAHRPGDLADEEDHRRRVLLRGVHADRGVGRARAAGDEGDAGGAGQLAPGRGHEAGAALLPVRHQPDAVGHVVQRVEHREIALAGHAEDRRRALRQQAVHQEPGPGRAHRRPPGARRSHFPRRW